MRKILIGAIAAVALSVSAPASAADLAARPYTKAPPPAVAAINNWSGFYVGFNGGGVSSHKCWDLNGLAEGPGRPITPVSPAMSEGCHDATGGLVGGQIGYRWQASNWVFGLEAQGDWADLKGSNLISGVRIVNPGVTNQTKIDAIGLFTAQVGYAWNNVLWYVKGGAALTHDKYNGVDTAIALVVDQASETRWGGAVGTGIEFGVAPGWSVALEYDHLFMGERTLTFTNTEPRFLGLVTRSDSITQDVDMATVRVNYTFGGPVIAKY
jgi:outer membrane immunogenic protein